MKISLLQLNYIIGDYHGNSRKILAATKDQLQEEYIDLFVTSELALTGYPPKDQLLNKTFICEALKELEWLAEELKTTAPLLIGAPQFNPNMQGKPLYNSCYLLENGFTDTVIQKKLLPNYDVFDEERYFESSKNDQILNLGSKKIGVTICEDLWNDLSRKKNSLYLSNPVKDLRRENVDFIINLSSSPFSAGKQAFRENMLSEVAKKSSVPVLYVNQIGGNDDLIFDGRSCAFGEDGSLIGRARGFEEDRLVVNLSQSQSNRIEVVDESNEEIYKALVLGTRDYVRKCGFSRVVLGLSGGIDSTLTAAIAVEALGADNVIGVMMPSPYSSDGSIDDSVQLAENLGIQTMKIPIANIMQSFKSSLESAFFRNGGGYNRRKYSSTH